MSVYYETGIEEPEIMGSGSQRSCIVTTSNEEEAKAIFKIGGRNYLQKITTIPGKRVIEEWDAKSQRWVPQDIYQRYSPDRATVVVTLNKEELKKLGLNTHQCDTSKIVKAIHEAIQHEKGEITMTVNEIREMYPVGTQVMLKKMEGEPQMASGTTGIVTHIDDAGQIHVRWENGSSLALNAELDAFSKIEPTGKITVLLVEPGRTPKMIEIEDTLEAKQAVVGGYIEQSMPFDDDVAIICNEEGKLEGLHLNRAIYDNDGTMIDIIAGTFFICYAPIESDRYLSLPETLAKKYMEKFKYPEIFYRDHDGIRAMPYKTGNDK